MRTPLLATAAVIAVLAVAPAAHADAEEFLDTVSHCRVCAQRGHPINITGNEGYLLSLAALTCRMELQGSDVPRIADYIRDSQNLPDIVAFQIAATASTYYCM